MSNVIKIVIFNMPISQDNTTWVLPSSLDLCWKKRTPLERGNHVIFPSHTPHVNPLATASLILAERAHSKLGNHLNSFFPTSYLIFFPDWSTQLYWDIVRYWDTFQNTTRLVDWLQKKELYNGDAQECSKTSSKVGHDFFSKCTS